MILGMDEYIFYSDVLLCANSFLSVVCPKSVNKRKCLLMTKKG